MAIKDKQMAEMTAMLRRWRVRVALEDESVLAARGSLLALLKELAGGGETTLLVGHVVGGNAHFNALEQLARACTQQRIWSGVLPVAQGAKQLVVYVPRFSSADKVAAEIQRMAVAIGLELALNVTNCDGGVPHFVVDALVTSIVMHELEAAGCTIFGDLAERQIVLSRDAFSGEISTIVMPRIQWHYDPYTRSCSIEMTCIPAVMKLKTIAEEQESDEDAPDDYAGVPSWHPTTRVRVLPRMSECWIVSRFEYVELSLEAGNPDDVNPSRPFSYSQGAYPTSQQSKYGCSTPNVTQLPRTDDEFRSYWQHVHGIRLPEYFGGYARVRFSGKSILTYPACCVATEWAPLFKQTRLEGLDVVRGFAAMMRQLFGEQSVSITSPHDQAEKTAVLLPASALLKAEIQKAPQVHCVPSQSETTHTKRRMIARDRYTVS